MSRKVLVGLAVAALVAATALAGPAAKKRVKGHPEVDVAEACDTCHADVTPEVVDNWYLSKHGVNNVKCFVCHGSVGKDFVRRAPIDRCVGCHAEEVASMAQPGLAKKDCFSCHPAHTLSPHLAELRGGEK